MKDNKQVVVKKNVFECLDESANGSFWNVRNIGL